MTLKQLQNLTIIDQDITNEEYGTFYDKRSLDQLLKYGLILLNKPPGPTSHETVAWTKRILKIPKIGHSGTLDPQVSGVLPLGLGDATKALNELGWKPKVSFDQLIDMMIEADLELANKEKTLLDAGYKVGNRIT